MLSRAFVSDVTEAMSPEVAEKVYSAAMHGYGRLRGAEAWKEKGLHADLLRNLHATLVLVADAIKTLDPKASRESFK